ncbi:unnamed protein product [Penicillium salamii]|nr:unnamed protein product [Penicillium salamii]CAG8421798.1 unnamed protein product [Penicillium salamii]
MGRPSRAIGRPKASRGSCSTSPQSTSPPSSSSSSSSSSPAPRGKFSLSSSWEDTPSL